jgi:hypothetical protein
LSDFNNLWGSFWKIYPFIYILLKNKKEISYTTALLKCNELFKLYPKNFICDFEKGLINSIVNVFPNTEINGCLFHFGQSVWKRIQHSGLTSLYRSNKSFKIGVKMMILCAFIPPSDVRKSYFMIKNWMIDNISEKVDVFFEYFEQNYVGGFEEKGDNVENQGIKLNFGMFFQELLKMSQGLLLC